MARKNKGSTPNLQSLPKGKGHERMQHSNLGGFTPFSTDPSVNTYNATMMELDLQTDSIGPILEKVTAGFFTGGTGQVNAGTFYTASIADSNEAYYVDVTDANPDSSSAATSFSVTFGHYAGSGSNCGVSNQEYGPTQAIYGQLANLLLPINHMTGGFMIDSSTTRDDYVYALIAERSLMKDKLNKKQWTLAMNMNTASIIDGGAKAFTDQISSSNETRYFTDDSANVPGVATPGGMRYNIVSGSDGTVVQPATTQTYGWFYPEMGIMLFSGTALSASMPGSHASGSVGSPVVPFKNKIEKDVAAVKISHGMTYGLNPSTGGTRNEYNMLRFVNALTNDGGYLKLRNEEDQYSRHYFVRATANNFNFSNNSTFTSGSNNRLKYDYMLQNPQVFITGVGLFDGGGNLVAVAKLSTPIQKNFQSEATIKVKLTY